MPTENTIENAKLALPHLVRIAQQRRTITYKELTDQIDRHWRTAPHFLGYIRDEICMPRGLPLINAIVVNRETQLPGDSWLPEGVHNLSIAEKRSKYEDQRDEIFAFEGWVDLLEELGLTPIPLTFDEYDDEGRAYSDYIERKGGVGEAEPHRVLKEFVASNPARLGIDGVVESIQEYDFISGDKCDVVFDLGSKGVAVVEVKNGIRGELVKGIYQAIKYRALMIAEKGHGGEYPVSAYLVAYDIPEDIIDYASRFDVKCFTIQSQELG